MRACWLTSREQIDAENAAHRASQVRTMDRWKAYPYVQSSGELHCGSPGYKAYNLDAVLNGDLEPVVQSGLLRWMSATSRSGCGPGTEVILHLPAPILWKRYEMLVVPAATAVEPSPCRDRL